MARRATADYASEDYLDPSEEEELLPLELEDRRGRLALLFGTSYGISFLVHLAILLVLAAIAITAPQPEPETVISVKREEKPPELRPEAERSTERTPDVPLPVEQQVVPIIVTDEVEVTQEQPQGTDLSNLTDKNLDADSTCDVYGPAGAAAGKYGHRNARGAHLQRLGFSKEADEATEHALDWLRRHQAPDGRWDADGWRAGCKDERCSGAGAEAGDGRYDVGVSALSLLAFLGRGHTHRYGHFRETVSRGLRWLRAQQRADGSLGFEHGHEESIYNHAIATMALAEAYGMSRDFTLRRAVERAVQFCVEAQNPGLGWKYGLKSGRNDTSVTGWMVLALKAAAVAGVDVPREAFTGAAAWLQRATDSRGLVGYETPGGGSAVLGPNDGRYDAVPCMTAVSVLCRLFTGEKRHEDELRRGAQLLEEHLPRWPEGDVRPINFYYWYYGTYAMFQMGDGAAWERWNAAMLEALCPRQRRGTCANGSWDPVGEWCLAGGRVYATAINVLTLEIYYRYERAQEKTERPR